MRAGQAPVASFFAACLDVIGWGLEPAWPERMRSLWLALQPGAVPAGLLDDPSRLVRIDAAFVNERLDALAVNEDLSRYVL